VKDLEAKLGRTCYRLTVETTPGVSRVTRTDSNGTKHSFFATALLDAYARERIRGASEALLDRLLEGKP
jgi:hypothetical protein